jgi:hypothetical protein
VEQGNNVFNSAQRSGNLVLNQNGQQAQQQQVYLGALYGSLNLNQQGSAFNGNEAYLGNIYGNASVNAQNLQGRNQVFLNGVQGRSDLSTMTYNAADMNRLQLANLRGDNSITSTGNTLLNLRNSGAVNVSVNSVAGSVNNHIIALEGTNGQNSNSVNVNALADDQISINLMGNLNGTEVFFRNMVKHVDIQAKNNRRDTFYVKEGTQLDVNSLDDYDTLVISGGNGAVSSKTAGQLKQALAQQVFQVDKIGQYMGAQGTNGLMQQLGMVGMLTNPNDPMGLNSQLGGGNGGYSSVYGGAQPAAPSSNGYGSVYGGAMPTAPSSNGYGSVYGGAMPTAPSSNSYGSVYGGAMPTAPSSNSYGGGYATNGPAQPPVGYSNEPMGPINSYGGSYSGYPMENYPPSNGYGNNTMPPVEALKSTLIKVIQLLYSLLGAF